MLRKYLMEYQTINNCGKVTIDNNRRSLSTFFLWLEEEDYIESRTDNNIALFFSLNKAHNRITESGVELRLREIGFALLVRQLHF